MSGESERHIKLVEFLIDHVEAQHNALPGYYLLADHRRFGENTPYLIGGFKPDLFASDLPCTFRVIGEAKTRQDLESERSLRQLRAFVAHLAINGAGILYLSVPWLVAPRARTLVRQAMVAEDVVVPFEVLQS